MNGIGLISLSRAARGVVWLAPLLWPAALPGQVRASERGGVSQVIDGTTIEVSYGRPQLRGRTAFGGVVHWGEIWTPGANWATTFTTSKAIRLGGHPVAAGSYSVWISPNKPLWTFYLHREARRYHLQRPNPADMAVAIEIRPGSGPPTEILTFEFPAVRRAGAILRFRWGSTRVELPIEVEATATSRPLLPAAQVAPYLGRYDSWSFGEHGDSTALRVRLSFEEGHLRGVINEATGFELFPTGQPHEFWYEARDRQGPKDVELDGPLTFQLGPDGLALGFRMPGIEQPLWWRGVRIR